MPCSILSLDVQDVMGSHTVNIHGTLNKIKLDKNGNVLGEEVYDSSKEEHHGSHSHTPQPNIQDVMAQIQNGEGCQLTGNFYVNKVPGNFHISCHAYGPTIQRIVQKGFHSFDFSHIINHLSFGEDQDLKHIRSKFNVGVLNPIDNTKKQKEPSILYEYYLKVVPTTYVDLNNNNFYVHQFTSNSNEVRSYNSIPAVFFR